MSNTRDHVITIDQGTTGTTVLILDSKLQIRGRGYQEFPQIFPEPGWVEHSPDEIWRSVIAALGAALTMSGVDGQRIAAIGITNQRETTILWDRRTGEPVMNGIVWQCRRTADICSRLKAAGHEELFRSRTGLVLDPYFSGTKVRWMLENVAGLNARAEAGDIAFGTVDSYLIWRLTGGAVHVTDVSNASRTLFLDLKRCAWDPELLSALEVPAAILPQVRDSAEVYGSTQGTPGLPDGIPIAGIAGDQQAALFGQACFEPGDAKCTYGTGAFILQNTGSTPIPSKNGLLTTIGWRIGDQLVYALEGSTFIAGAAVQWLRDGLGLIENAADIEALAASVPDAGGVSFVPALVGLGAPHWRADARGIITGITRGTTAAHLARATLDGIAFQVAELLDAMGLDAGARLDSLKVDGGASANDLLMARQADLLGVEVIRPKMVETTALGAAFLAGLSVGVWNGMDELRSAWQEDRRFQSTLPTDDRSAAMANWRAAVERA